LQIDISVCITNCCRLSVESWPVKEKIAQSWPVKEQRAGRQRVDSLLVKEQSAYHFEMWYMPVH
jgi:hypothetical protein